MRIERNTPGLPPIRPRAVAPRSGFTTLLDSVAEAETGTTLPAAQASAAGIYEAASRAVTADREARRHGRAMLNALAAVQHSALAGPPSPDAASAGTPGSAGALADLAALASHAPPADDPLLRLILREIGVRAAVELARGNRTTNVSIG